LLLDEEAERLGELGLRDGRALGRIEEPFDLIDPDFDTVHRGGHTAATATCGQAERGQHEEDG
jgi:hypothetical protein